MKQCPNCKTTYTDDALRFCLADGANLISMSEEAPPTVQMSFNKEPMRVNIPSDSTPTVFVPTPNQQNQPVKKGFGLIIAAVLGVLFLIAIVGGIGAFVFFRQNSSDKNAVVSASPTPSTKPTVSSTATTFASPNDEIERLKEEKASLQKQLQNQKNQTSNSSVNTTSPPKQTLTTARANSPRDGFLALRSEPNSENGYRIAQIPHGATVTVLGCPKPSNVGKMPGRWCQVVYNGQAGWAFDAFMIF
jgi:flagellar basal body-associated protein FliL